MHLGWKLFNLPELEQDLRDCLTKAFDIALKKRVDYVFIVGDLYDTNRPSPDTIKFVADQVARLTANGIIVAGIAGDHDKPVNDSTWVHLSGILPMSSMADWLIGLDYSDNSQSNIDKLDALTPKQKSNLEWIFLHGQVPELFAYTEDKKKLDIKSLDIINKFPNLKGVVLGDIHSPLDGVISDPTQVRKDEPWIGYCGSLGMVKTDEIGTKEGLLYWDGTKLSRIPFELDRKFIRLNLGDSLKPINWVEKYKRFFQDNTGKKPVFIIEHDKNSKSQLPEIAPLYEVGIVKITNLRKTEDKKEETINIRSELKTNSRLEATLKECAQEQDLYDLLLGTLVSEDPKAVLDKFKIEAFADHETKTNQCTSNLPDKLISICCSST